jgi:hypothetical protein
MTLLNPLRSVYAQELSWIALCDTACVYGLNFIVQWGKKDMKKFKKLLQIVDSRGDLELEDVDVLARLESSSGQQ